MSRLFEITPSQAILIEKHGGGSVDKFMNNVKKVMLVYPNQARELNRLAKKINADRRVVSREASKANKRIKRLMNKPGGDQSPAMQSLLNSGEPKFGVKGKSNAEVKEEYARLQHFIKLKTSTIKGVNDNLKTMFKTFGLDQQGVTINQYESYRQYLPQLFSIMTKAQEIGEQMGVSAIDLGYRKVIEHINEQIEVLNLTGDTIKDNLNLIEERVNTVISNMKRNIAPPSDGFGGPSVGINSTPAINNRSFD